ncbi:tail protein X [Thiomicrorhabdus sp. Kp2]|uniref:tail protein X n=1 Tax=Thiomicrorhabdus sp. Kp2 TaxID=1123518 RepID=UPI00041849CB|nr:tail protein X [Thiomicrorhabdus sp. Kp2]
MKYRSQDGDTLDLICHHYYGATSGYVEQVLEANPKLANHVVLPAGVLVELPELTRLESPEEQSGIWS